MPALNAAKTIRSAVQSIVNQTYQDWELLIFDDGSTDGTLDILNDILDPRVTIISDCKNLGIANRMNMGISLAKGRYFARMDSDDIAYPHRIAEEVKYLNEHQEVDLVGSATLFFKNNGAAIGKQVVKSGHHHICSRPWDSIPVPHPTWMARTEWIAKHKYSTYSRMSEDQDLLLRACNTSIYACIPEILLAYRQNNIAITKELKSRVSLAFDLARYYSCRNQYLMLSFAFIYQIFKASIVVFSVIFGVQEKVLYRRFGTLSVSEVSEWKTLYNTLNENNL